jgi:hypothetical protein
MGTLEQSVPDAIRAFGLYFSEIPEFDCKPVLFPSDRQMTTQQAIILGMLLALTPSALFLTWVLWQEGKLPPHDQLGLPYRRFENTASDLIDCAEHINDEITTQQELVARLRLINSCRLILVAVGFTVSMDQSQAPRP